MNKKSIITLVICVVVVLAVVGTTVGVSLAYWKENKADALYVRFPVTDENPSLKYQMYVPVKASGHATTTDYSAYTRIAGTPHVTRGVYSYELADPSETSSIVGFALVGWYGGVALEELDIPDNVTVTIDSASITKPVVRVMMDADFSDYSFSGDNTVIEKIVVGKNVAEIDQSAFFGMARLKTLEYVFNENINYYLYLRPYAFAGCPNLVIPDNERAQPATWDTSTVSLNSGTMN